MSYIPILILTFMLLVVATGIIVLVLVYQKKQLQYLNEKEQLKAGFEKEILESKLEIQEQTMKNISQEVHDNIGQVLSVAKLNLNLMHSDDNMLQESITDTATLVSKAIHDLRDLSKSLDSDAITEKGLVKAMEYEFDLLKKTKAYQTYMVVEGEICPIATQKELILFRMCQEAINNIIKHAQATRVDISFVFRADVLTLQIQDNGQGFDVNHPGMNYGSGLRNMKNRSQMIGAYYCVDSVPGQGTMVKIELPLHS